MKLFCRWNREKERFDTIIEMSTNYNDPPHNDELEKAKELKRDPAFYIIRIDSADGKVIQDEASAQPRE